MQKRNLSSRQKLILTYMNGKHSVVPGKELAERLGVSTRTVRFAVSEMNDLLREDGISVDAVSGKGYRLSVRDRERFHELISDREIIHTKEDRIVYLIMRFISSDDWVNLSELEDDIFVSRTTLENDIREIRKRICEHEPYIMMKRKNNAILLEDDEMKKRNVLLHLYSESWDFDSREGISFRNGLADREIMEEIRLALIEMLREYEIDLDDYGMVNMKIAVSLIYSRNIEGHRLYNAGADKRYGICRKAVDHLLDNLRRSWEIELEEADYTWLADWLERLTVLGLNQREYESVARKAGRECERIADRLTAELQMMFGVAFPDDEIFRTQLLLGVQAFRNQQISTQAQSRFSTDLLEKNYAFLGDVARYMMDRLSELTGKSFRVSENNWLLPVLCSAAERRERQLREKITVVVVSHVNDGLTQYMVDNLYKLFGTRCRITAVVPVHDRRAALALKPSFVITTVRMQLFGENGIPSVVSSPIVTEEEMIRIDSLLQRVERSVLHEGLPLPIDTYLGRGGELKADRKSTTEDLIREAYHLWKKNGIVSPDAETGVDGFRYILLRGDDFLIYRAGDITETTCFTKISVDRSIALDKFRSIRNLYIGLISANDRKLLPAFVGELDFMGKTSDFDGTVHY